MWLCLLLICVPLLCETLSIKFTLNDLLYRNPRHTTDIILTSFEITENNLDKIDALLRFQNQFFLPYMSERVSKDRQMQLLPFVSNTDYHETIFHRDFLLNNGLVLEEIFLRQGDYAGNLLGPILVEKFSDNMVIYAKALIGAIKLSLINDYVQMSPYNLITLFFSYPSFSAKRKLELLASILEQKKLIPILTRGLYHELGPFVVVDTILNSFQDQNPCLVSWWFLASTFIQGPEFNLVEGEFYQALEAHSPSIFEKFQELSLLHDKQLADAFENDFLSLVEIRNPEDDSFPLAWGVAIGILINLAFSQLSIIKRPIGVLFIKYLDVLQTSLPRPLILNLFQILQSYGMINQKLFSGCHLHEDIVPYQLRSKEDKISLFHRLYPPVLVDDLEELSQDFFLDQQLVPLNLQAFGDLPPHILIPYNVVEEARVYSQQEENPFESFESLDSFKEAIRTIYAAFNILLVQKEKEDFYGLFRYGSKQSWDQFCYDIGSFASRLGKEVEDSVIEYAFYMFVSPRSKLSMFSLPELRSLVDSSYRRCFWDNCWIS